MSQQLVVDSWGGGGVNDGAAIRGVRCSGKVFVKLGTSSVLKSIFVATTLLLSAGGSAVGQQSGLASSTTGMSARAMAAPAIAAVRASDPPRIDGRLDDPAWADAPIASQFVQFRPSPGEAPTEQTEVRVLYTNDAVYVGARMHDSDPDAIIRRLARRDEDVVTDQFIVAIDSYFDRRTAFAFSVSVAGVQNDQRMFADTDEDSSWDAVWESATTSDGSGWTAELRIPLSQLRFARPQADGSGTTWGVNFMRFLARLDERSVWSPLPGDGSRMVSAFGTLRGIEGIQPRRNIELRPYVLSSATRAPESSGNPFYSATDMFQSFGGDLKVGVTNNLTLNVTVNPDFGQVEADPAVVNLSAFETFFEEKRPFFQEGADIFSFELGGGGDNQESLFYSRRVGRPPQGFVREAAEFEDMPGSTTILGAAKLSGKTADGWSIGLLNALTSRETARFQPFGGGGLGEQLVEPLTNYAAARVIKDFNDGESALGFIGTAVNRSVDPEGPVSFLPATAVSGGLDFRHRLGGGDYQISGYLLGSAVSGNPTSIERLQRSSRRYYQRPDASHVTFDPARTSLSGFATQVEFARIGGSKWNYGIAGNARSPGFEVNDIGFQQNADQAWGAAWLGYNQFEPQGPFRRWGASISAWSAYTTGGEHLGLGSNINTNFQLKNFWGGYGGFGQERAGVSPTALRGGPALYTPNSWFAFGGLFTDGRKPVRFGVNLNAGGEYGTDSGRLGISPNVTLQPSSGFELTLGPGFFFNDRDWQYIAQPESDTGTHYVFGRLDQQTVSLTTRLNYTFSPDLSLQLYAQPFVSAGSYDNHMEVADPRAPAFTDRFRIYGDSEIQRVQSGDFGRYEVDEDADGTADFAFSDPDFNIKSFRSNVVLRWQYRPGSTVFLVWSRDQGSFLNDGSFEFGRDFGDVFDIPSTNVFLIKFEHWLGL